MLETILWVSLHQLDSLKELRYDERQAPYFSTIDSILYDARYSADRGIAMHFPKAYEHLDIQCDTYIQSEDGTKYVHLLRKSKGIFEDARKSSSLSLDLSFCFDGVKYSWRPEDKVKYSTKAFLKRTSQITTKSDGAKIGDCRSHLCGKNVVFLLLDRKWVTGIYSL